MQAFRIATWVIEPRLNTVSRNGTTTRLEPKVMEVLVCLARRAGEPVSKEELLQTVWPGTFVTDDGLKRSISELRRLFEDDVRESRIIQTIPKRGYRLLVPIELVDRPQSAASIPPSEKSRKWPRHLLLYGGIVGLLLMVLGTFYVSSRGRTLGKGNDPQIRSIAVLPLQNLSGDPNQEYFSDGITDALITDLAQIGSIKVISRTSSMQYKQTKRSLPEIGRELHVDGIIEGTVQRSGDRVRITAQLIHSPSDTHLWANSYEQDFRDVFALERNVTEDIARQVQARLATQDHRPVPQPHQTTPTTLEAYLQGNYHLHKYGRGSGVVEKRKAAEFFQKAIDADPTFVPAYIGLANAYDDLPVNSREDKAIRRKAAETALALDPNSSDARLILTGIEADDFDWPRAEKAYQLVVGLDPNNAYAHDGFCMFLAEMGRQDEALRECQIAQELDPTNDHLGGISYLRGDYNYAIETLQMMIDRHPDDGGLHFTLFECYVKQRNSKAAVRELEKTLKLYGFSSSAARIHDAFVTSGYRASMLQSAKEVEHLQADQQFYLPVNLADFYAILGDNDRAFYWLEQAYIHRDMISTGEGAMFIGVDPMLVPLRSDPRFKYLLRRIGLPIGRFGRTRA